MLIQIMIFIYSLAKMIACIMSLGLAGVLVAYWYFRRSLPVLRGSMAVPGLKDSVEIIRDVDGVPHIYSGSKEGAYFGLGYVHAQERLWQMETQRRLGSGRLAEVLGKRAVPMDRYFRTVGMHRAAVQTWRVLPERVKKTVEAYVAGINAFIRTECQKAAPPEFVLLRVKPEEWSAVDVLLCGKLMAWNLGGLFFLQLLREDLINKLGAERAHELMPDSTVSVTGLESGSKIESALASAGPASEEVFYPQNRHGGAIGSNSWVVGGERSITGKPLLACDPHLSTAAPATFYVAHICAEGLNVAGATVPGLPCVVIGRNENIAWGMTNLNAAVQDLFLERPVETGRAEGRGPAQDSAEDLVEVIRVRSKPEVQIKIRVTAHGPVISNAMNANNTELPERSRRDQRPAMSLSWTALRPGDATLAAFLGINEASNWAEFRGALVDYVAPAVNFTYADVHGNIAYCAAGQVPIRDSQHLGRVQEGWTSVHDWKGFIPQDQLPWMHNPTSGYIVTANTRNEPDGYSFFIGPDLVEPFRHIRIEQLLNSKERLSLHDHALIQGDTLSLHAQELLPALLDCLDAECDDWKTEIELLKDWDCDMRSSSAAACVFAAWFLRLPVTLLSTELGPGLLRDYHPWVTYVHRYLRSIGRANSRTAIGAELPDGNIHSGAVRQAFAETVKELRRKLGPDAKSWRWDRLHRALFPHQPFQNFPVLQRWFSRSVPSSGDWSTVNVGGTWTMAKPFQQVYAATYRQIIDLADLDGGVFILAPGQSGHFLSHHYADYLSDWSANRYRPIRMKRSTVERDAESSLLLKPNQPKNAG